MNKKIASNKEYDVIIVGAGPAGCSASTFIAQQGYSVLLLDKAKFPRDKVCGDGVSSLALNVLDRMGVSNLIEKKKPWKSNTVLISSPAGKITSSKIPHIDGFRDYGYVFPRHDLDFLLFKYAKSKPNVNAIENFEVKDLVYQGDKICGIRGISNNQQGDFLGKFIIGADGAHSIIAKKLSLYNNHHKHRAFALRAYFDNVEDLKNCIEIYYDEAILPGYGWIFPTGESTANIGVGIFNRFMGTKGIKNLFNLFIEKNKHVKEKLKKAKMRESSLKGGLITLGSYPSKRSNGNVLLIGDAGSFVDTLTGEGIYYALKSGEYCSEAVISGLYENKLYENIGDVYEKLWKKEFRWKEFKLGYFFQPFFNYKTFLNMYISRLSNNQKKAEILAGVVAHQIPKTRLFLNL